MTEQEIREKLRRLKEGQLRGDEWMTAYGWAVDELERQLDHNHKLDTQAADAITDKCQWTFDDNGVYQTACGGAWQLTSGDLLENEVKFCPFCGGQIEEVK